MSKTISQIFTLFVCLLLAVACGKEAPDSESLANPPQKTSSTEKSAQIAARARLVNEQAIQAFQAGDHEDALEKFLEAHNLDKDNEVIRKNIARCYAHIATKAFNERRFKDAARDFKLAEDYDPKEVSYGLSRGKALLEDRLLDQASRVLEAVVERFPSEEQSRGLLGLAYYNLGRNKDAIDTWKEALKRNPKDEIAKAYLKKVSLEESVEEKLDEDFGAQHFRIKFDGRSDPRTGRMIGELLEDAYEEVGRALGVHPDGDMAVVVYPGKTFQKVTGVHSWVQALYDGKIRIPGKGLKTSNRADLQRTIRHEYTHALIHRLAGRKCPVWLHEGLAQIIDGRDPSLARATISLGTPKLSSLSGSFVSVKDGRVVRLLYATAHLFTQWLADRMGGVWKFEDILRSLGSGKSLDLVLEDAVGAKLSSLYGEWKGS